jgi:hypothetical protein
MPIFSAYRATYRATYHLTHYVVCATAYRTVEYITYDTTYALHQE